MSVYCPDLNLLYLANPSTASTSILHFFRAKYDGIDTSKKHNYLDELLRNPGSLSREVIREAFVISSVRNPFDILATHYYKNKYRRFTGNVDLGGQKTYNSLIKDMERQRYTFEEFLRSDVLEICLLRQWQFTKGIDDVIVYELGMQSEIDRILKRAGTKNGHKMPHRNNIVGKDYRKLYDPKTKRIVKKKLKPWLEYAGYDFRGFHHSRSRLLRQLKGRSK